MDCQKCRNVEIPPCSQYCIYTHWGERNRQINKELSLVIAALSGVKLNCSSFHHAPHGDGPCPVVGDVRELLNKHKAWG